MKRSRIFAFSLIAGVVLHGCSQQTENLSSSTTAKNEGPRTVVVTRVSSQLLQRNENLPGDLLAYRDVAIYPKISGFVQSINVDRGSLVRTGQLLIRLTAPELSAQRASGHQQALAASDEQKEAEAELESVNEQQREAEATLKADRDTYERLKGASSYPGIIPKNDLEVAEQKAAADDAKVKYYEKQKKALRAKIRGAINKHRSAAESAQSSADIESYLRLTAPFDGIVTERNVHEGSFVNAPGDGKAQPLLRIQQRNLLRLVVPVPESEVGNIAPGMSVEFKVPAFAGATFAGVIKRVGGSLDANTRTMPVELDVVNTSGKLAPGMYAEVSWPVRPSQPSLLVPKTAVVKTTERTFVIRIQDGATQWVDVKVGSSIGDLVEVFGALADGDLIAVRGTDELRPARKVAVKQAETAPAKPQ
ncbi:MAG: efflux RND transporter periplasmic adaptor subunit [Candidatus Obscuribacterales bacterium]